MLLKTGNSFYLKPRKEHRQLDSMSILRKILCEEQLELVYDNSCKIDVFSWYAMYLSKIKTACACLLMILTCCFDPFASAHLSLRLIWPTPP